MKKIHLDLDTLVVESFTASASATPAQGTVEAHALSETAQRNCTAWATCEYTCEL